MQIEVSTIISFQEHDTADASRYVLLERQRIMADHMIMLLNPRGPIIQTRKATE